MARVWLSATCALVALSGALAAQKAGIRMDFQDQVLAAAKSSGTGPSTDEVLVSAAGAVSAASGSGLFAKPSVTSIGDGPRQPFAFMGDDDIHALIDSAFEKASQEVEDGGGASLWAHITVAQLHDWALSVLNPATVFLSDAELALYSELFDRYLARQGLAPLIPPSADAATAAAARAASARTPVSRGFLHSWATVGFLKDAAPQLAAAREDAQAVQRSSSLEELRGLDQHAA